MKPIRIAISPCLLGRPVRYDGMAKRAPHITEMFEANVQWVPTCPEIAIGLGVPRPTIRHELQQDGSLALIMPERDRLDLTERMIAFTQARVEALRDLNLHGCILKSRSPSCGIDDVEVHHHNGQIHNDGTGFWAKALLEQMPDLPITDEQRLLDPQMQEKWWTQVKERFAG